MRLWDIALFFMILNIFGTIFTDQLDLPSKVYLDMPEDLSSIESNVESGGLTDAEVTGTDPLTNALGWFYNMISTKLGAILNPLKKYVLFSAIVLITFGVPSAIAYGFTSIFLIIQIIGIVQLVTGRSFKEAE
ncbi:MAG: hypothetical protein ACTSVB_08005 [Candidatus Heimdallarchaeaceae archaeon]